MNASQSAQRTYVLDLLRFLAAIAILLYHYGFRGHAADGLCDVGFPALVGAVKYGYLGLYVFFMLSGYVILWSALRRGAADFLVSRALRLYPGFWICCTISFLAMLAFGGERYHATWPAYWENMTLLSGFFDVPWVDGAYWALFVEVKFYLLVFLVLTLKQERRFELFLGLWLVAAVTLAHWNLSPRWKDYLIVNYSAYVIAGCLFFILQTRGVTLYRLILLASSFAFGLERVLGARAALAEHYGVEFSAWVIAGVVVALFAFFGAIARGWNPLGRVAWLAVLGGMTYPLYLLHHNLGYMTLNAWHKTVPPYPLLALTVAGVLTLAWGVHKGPEAWLGRLLRRPRRT